MSNYITYCLLTKECEDAHKIYDKANELLKELNTADSAKIKFVFDDSTPTGEYGFSFDSYNNDLCTIALKIIEGVVASFPELRLHFLATWEGPIVEEAISKDGKLISLEPARDENGNVILDECGNVVFS